MPELGDIQAREAIGSARIGSTPCAGAFPRILRGKRRKVGREHWRGPEGGAACYTIVQQELESTDQSAQRTTINGGRRHWKKTSVCPDGSIGTRIFARGKGADISPRRGRYLSPKRYSDPGDYHTLDFLGEPLSRCAAGWRRQGLLQRLPPSSLEAASTAAPDIAREESSVRIMPGLMVSTGAWRRYRAAGNSPVFRPISMA